ncbi:MAG: glycosyltransferase [Candidatus Omnitrophica bacterium]|nr:glycosyltransferase [Candidatus Omnitrophota bacterium]
MNGKMKKKILVLCPAPVNVCPSQRLKYEQYFGYLKDNGYECIVSSFYSLRAWKIIHKRSHTAEKVFWVIFGYLRRTFDLTRMPFYHGLYVHLWVTPLGIPFFELMTKALNKKIVYDIDDMIFLKENNSLNKIWAALKGRKKPFALMRMAGHVIVCTPKLEEAARRFSSRVTDISSTINMQAYKPVKDYKKNETIALGWTGSFSGIAYLYTLANVLREVASKRKIKLLVIFNITDRKFELSGVDVENIPWQQDTEVEDLQKIEIGLYPLIKNEWSLGKSGLKALQYMALGIPVVATSFGANLRVIENGVSGFLVDSQKEWVDTIIKLIDDCDLRRRIGLASRQRVEKYFSLEVNRCKYLAIFEEVYNKKGRG